VKAHQPMNLRHSGEASLDFSERFVFVQSLQANRDIGAEAGARAPDNGAGFGQAQVFS
jgi:hypothetical protein